MKLHQRGRMAPAFILLVLSMEPKHGLGIYNKLEELFPGNRLDTAIIYRKLGEMEKKNCITSQWMESDIGPKKKVYSITEKGREVLSEFHDDIQFRIGMLSKFLEIHDRLKDSQ